VPIERNFHVAQLRAVGTSFLRLRPFVVAPMMAASLALLVSAHVPGEQLGGLTVGFATVLSFFGYEAWRGRRRLVSARQLFRSLALTTAGISFACVVTGGVGSPFLPMLFAPTVIAFAAFGARPGKLALAWLAGVVLVLLLIPPDIPFPAVPLAQRRAITALSMLCTGALLWIGVTSLTDAYASARQVLGKAGEDAVEAAEARGKALESLGAIVAHEIRNPLSAVKGLVELLIENGDQSRAYKRLDAVRGEVARMETILDDYLSFSRPWDELAPVSTDLGAVAREVVLLLEARAERDGVSLVAAGAGRGDGDAAAVRADADPRRLKEALLNLVVNALSATPAGGTVRISCASEGERAAIAVEDTGRGLDAATLARLGQPYFSARPDGTGTGLGVLLARQVAERHGGELIFESQPGRGTRATLTIPRHQAPDPHADRPAV
jgi:signal transduction histidine kinase